MKKEINPIESIKTKAWWAACTGNVQELKECFEGSMAQYVKGMAYEGFGRLHSLIAGAYRNGNMDAVRYLLSIGEKPLPEEVEEISANIDKDMDTIRNYIENINVLLRHIDDSRDVLKKV